MKIKYLLLIFLLLSTSTYSQLLFKTGWESGDILQNKFYRYSLAYTPYSNYPNGHSAKIDTTIFSTGKKSLKFELRDKDSSVSGGKRAELYVHSTDAIMKSVVWYSWSEYIPSNYLIDSRAELHMQVSMVNTPTNPNVALWLLNDKWYLNIKFDSAGTGIKIEKRFLISLPTVDKGKWTKWILYYKPSIKYDGRITLWKNGVKVFDRIGANANKINGALDISKYFKFGIYKWPWNIKGTYIPSTRITYFDDVAFYGPLTTVSEIINTK